MFNYQNNGHQGGSISINSGDLKTLQNARKDLVGELDAIIQYAEHLYKTNNALAKSTWENIRNEELVHVGELLGLLFYIEPYQKTLIENGYREFVGRLNKH